MMELNSKIKQLYHYKACLDKTSQHLKTALDLGEERMVKHSLSDTAWYSTKIKDLSEELGLFQFDFSEDGPEY